MYSHQEEVDYRRNMICTAIKKRLTTGGIYDLYSHQEEVDYYRILGHLNDIPPTSNIVVRANDTDILAI